MAVPLQLGTVWSELSQVDQRQAVRIPKQIVSLVTSALRVPTEFTELSTRRYFIYLQQEYIIYVNRRECC
jgi:hypothetical protein